MMKWRNKARKAIALLLPLGMIFFIASPFLSDKYHGLVVSGLVVLGVALFALSELVDFTTQFNRGIQERHNPYATNPPVDYTSSTSIPTVWIDLPPNDPTPTDTDHSVEVERVDNRSHTRLIRE